ncbi:TlpA disulfide reductase family protein [Butyricimonas paravirosa]|uniref:TlpA disulfide reductase family protein n=1 Tax=Butyricimonas paravirosa TaxID=1472417 RepID=UPI0021087B9D|nr:TlpA disulfide reductase family protein [Butyricimonas paravirosa]MCQ4874305.1 AhpC/TSA family protein [Butyricimonas paravirosa]
MKYICCLFVLIVFCACQKKDEGFVVRGVITGYPGTKLFVREIIPGNDAWINDTLEVKDGKFEYRGKVESPRLIYFIPQDFLGRYELFLENSEIELNVENGHYRDIKVIGSKSHEEFTAVTHASRELLIAYSQFEKRKNEAFKTDTELYKRREDSTSIWAGRLLRFLVEQVNYSGSLVLPYFASEWIKSEDIQNMESFINGLNPEARGSVYAQYCEKALKQAKKVQPGNSAYDFMLQDIEGKEYCLSDFRGSYVLLEFSASWCGWCKLEIPYLKQVYDLTKGKKFYMFTINLDKERKLWEENVKKESLPWPVLSDLKAFDGGIAGEYNVSGIPVIFLIDPDGKIVTNKLRGEGMISFIEQLSL